MIPDKKLKLDGDMFIVRVEKSQNSEKYVRICIRDQISKVIVADIKLSTEDFTDTLFGGGHVECDLELTVSEKIGKKRIQKEIDVWIRSKYTDNMPHAEWDELAKQAIAEFEVDGWSGCRSDLENTASTKKWERRGDCQYLLRPVTFVKWIDNKESGIAEGSEECKKLCKSSKASLSGIVSIPENASA